MRFALLLALFAPRLSRMFAQQRSAELRIPHSIAPSYKQEIPHGQYDHYRPIEVPIFPQALRTLALPRPGANSYDTGYKSVRLSRADCKNLAVLLDTQSH